MSDVGYTLEAKHKTSRAHIVAITLAEEDAKEVIRRLWPDRSLWGAPGGRSFTVETQAELDQINAVLKGQLFVSCSEEHSWYFHVYRL